MFITLLTIANVVYMEINTYSEVLQNSVILQSVSAVSLGITVWIIVVHSVSMEDVIKNLVRVKG